MNIARLEQYGLLQVAGEDARAFLHAQLTNDIENLAAGQARYAGWCSAKGRLLATFLVVPAAGGFLLQLSLDLVPTVLKRLSMFVLRSKVKITDATGQWAQFGIWGQGGGEPLSVNESGSEILVRIESDRTLVLSTKSRHAPDTPASDWALAEIRAVARHDPAAASAVAVIFLEVFESLLATAMLVLLPATAGARSIRGKSFACHCVYSKTGAKESKTPLFREDDPGYSLNASTNVFMV